MQKIIIKYKKVEFLFKNTYNNSREENYYNLLYEITNDKDTTIANAEENYYDFGI